MRQFASSSLRCRLKAWGRRVALAGGCGSLVACGQAPPDQGQLATAAELELGAHVLGDVVRFTVASPDATRVEVWIYAEAQGVP